MTRIAGLAGNRGRNLLHIADTNPGGASLAVVLTNDSSAPVLEAAGERGIDTEVVERDSGEDRREHERRINDVLADYDVDLVCLDGYLRILSETFLDAQPPTFNVHPSLLPSFPGTDAWGDALEAGVSVTGCTVHLVTDATDESGAVIEDAVDTGPIITQEPVLVSEADTRETLKERVLYEGEFRAYPRAVSWFATDEIQIDDDGAVTVLADTDAEQGLDSRRLTSSDQLDTLRYGENPHQEGEVYVDYAATEPSVVRAEHRNEDAKGLSYNNYNDADAALALVSEFDDPAAAVIKHTNPAGCATADSLSVAYERALATDPMSSFGGIVALNRPCDDATAAAIIDSFKEVVVAPGYTDAGLDVLREKTNLRVLDVGSLRTDATTSTGRTESDLLGGRLVQDRDTQSLTPADLEIVTDRAPTEAERETMCFAWQTVKHVKSNAIVLATGTETVGIGMGQVSRVDAVQLAVRKAREHAEGKDCAGAVMASDAFFPFSDGVELAADAGIEAVVQPGGSQNDAAVIEAANDHGLAMALTGTRSFRHD